VFVAIGVAALQRTVWWAMYDFRNCEWCQPRIDWQSSSRAAVTEVEKDEFDNDGVTVLKSAVLDTALITELGKECDRLPNTFLSNVIANFILKFYLRYEHRLETRSEQIRDWAMHGPFAKWAAQLLNTSEVRLYNTELIFHRGDQSPSCQPAWHRDSVAAPFDPEVTPSAVFNIYLHDIDAEHDGLVYVRGSHKDPTTMPETIDIIEPRIAVGDVLVHAANSYHTTSGRGCFNRRSLQFRYFAGGATFSHGPSRQAGPIPWTFAHAVGIAPHGLNLGDALEGKWYPQVYPKLIEDEQGRVPDGQAWGLLKLGSFIKESTSLMNGTAGKPAVGAIVMDGVVRDPEDWEWKPFGNSSVMLPQMKKAAHVKKIV